MGFGTAIPDMVVPGMAEGLKIFVVAFTTVLGATLNPVVGFLLMRYSPCMFGILTIAELGKVLVAES
jgi:hypothetical protein